MQYPLRFIRIQIADDFLCRVDEQKASDIPRTVISGQTNGDNRIGAAFGCPPFGCFLHIVVQQELPAQ